MEVGISIQKLPENMKISDYDPVTVKQTGNIFEIRLMERTPVVTTLKISKDLYIDLREDTGEVKEYRHNQNRAQSIYNVRQSMKKLRDLINCNVTDPQRCRWVTLTYRENMKDPVQLYHDFRKFHQRFLRYVQKQYKMTYQYIVAMEPQKRGAWHAHCIFIFEKKAPFIENKVLAGIWGQGFVNVRSLADIDNVGLYLTAYLCDMDVLEAKTCGLYAREKLKIVDSCDDQGKPIKKMVIKGARLNLYPTGFRLFRHSRGINYPTITHCSEIEAQQMIGNAPKVFEKTIQVVTNDKRLVNKINYRQYNRSLTDEKATQRDTSIYRK